MQIVLKRKEQRSQLTKKPSALDRYDQSIQLSDQIYHSMEDMVDVLSQDIIKKLFGTKRKR